VTTIERTTAPATGVGDTSGHGYLDGAWLPEVGHPGGLLQLSLACGWRSISLSALERRCLS